MVILVRQGSFADSSDFAAAFEHRACPKTDMIALKCGLDGSFEGKAGGGPWACTLNEL